MVSSDGFLRFAVGEEALLGGSVADDEIGEDGGQSHKDGLCDEGGLQRKAYHHRGEQGGEGHGGDPRTCGTEAYGEAVVGMEPVTQQQRHGIDDTCAIGKAREDGAEVIDEGITACHAENKGKHRTNEGGNQNTVTQGEFLIIYAQKEGGEEGEKAADGENGAAHTVTDAPRLNEGEVDGEDIAA